MGEDDDEWPREEAAPCGKVEGDGGMARREEECEEAAEEASEGPDGT